MKALVLAAGRGSRLSEETADHNKCMLRLRGKPLVQYSLENAVQARVSEIIVVVGYHAEDIINGFGIDFNGTRIQYVIQDDPRGLVHAIETAGPAIGDEDFMLFLADEILWSPQHADMVRAFEQQDLFETRSDDRLTPRRSPSDGEAPRCRNSGTSSLCSAWTHSRPEVVYPLT